MIYGFLISLLAGTVSALLGLGGGILLLAALGQLLPAYALIPTHGIIQLFSNFFRASLGFRSLKWPVIRSFAIGAVVGAGLGRLVLVNISSDILTWVLGLYLVAFVWIPLPQALLLRLKFSYPFIGALSAFLSLFVGVSGPFIHPILQKEKLPKESFIATEAACAGWTHLLKIIIFFSSGFDFLAYFSTISVVTSGVILGLLIGHYYLKKMSDEKFQILIKIAISIMGLRMIVKTIL